MQGMPYADLIPSLVFGFVMMAFIAMLAVYSFIVGSKISDSLKNDTKSGNQEINR